jgi:hypothetical protein
VRGAEGFGGHVEGFVGELPAGVFHVERRASESGIRGVAPERWRRRACRVSSPWPVRAPLAPFSQNWKLEPRRLPGHAQPGQSKPSGLFVRNSAAAASGASICSRIVLAVARNAP